jgi:hypothetical protein
VFCPVSQVSYTLYFPLLSTIAKFLQAPCTRVLQNAYLVPRSEADWFDHHGQAIHNSHVQPTAGVNHVSNGIAMRADLHIALDASLFTPRWCKERLLHIF